MKQKQDLTLKYAISDALFDIVNSPDGLRSFHIEYGSDPKRYEENDLFVFETAGGNQYLYVEREGQPFDKRQETDS